MMKRPVEELCQDGGPLWPMKFRHVKEQLHHGKFQGIGYQLPGSNKWVLDDADVEAIWDRLRPAPVELDPPSRAGLSKHSRTLRQIRRAAS